MKTKNRVKKTSILKPCLFFIFLCINSIFRGQDIDRILNSKAFSHNGSVALNAMSNFGQGLSNPFTYVLFGTYTLEFFGIALPFSMMYSNQKLSYGQSFLSWQLAPSYRWIRAQFGETNVQFSPYSLSGHQFRGAVIDVKPNQHWTVTALYGRLNDYREADSDGQNGSLLRLCYGTKIAYNSSKYGISSSFFKAKDVTNANVDLAPQENVVLSFSAHWTLAKNIRISGDLANSALTKNTNDELVRPHFKIQNWAGLCLPYRLSTSVFHAYKINLGSPFLSVGYEYVAPHYHSLGAHYFTNDFENFTVNGLHKFRNIAIGGRFGVQNDDPKNQKINSNRQVVYAANLDYSGNSRIFGQLNYSTFQTISRVEKFLTEFENTNPYASLDTLVFRQVERHGDLTIGYRFRESEHSQQQIQLFVSMQSASQNGRFVTSSVNYAWSQKSGKNLGASAFLYRDAFADESRSSLGLTVFFGSTFSEKRGRWRITVSETHDTYNRRNCLILKASTSYVFRKKHPIQMQFSQRFGKDYSAMVSFSYGYSFGR
ncbi:MAG: hypothetical protein LBH22_03185 [Bacteroidales bacterium]|jgi:hypothetical protein|nr:hypothetical protein [Bacteroidales bacterium]